MKKYFITISIFLASQGLTAITGPEITTDLQTQADKYKEALNTSISMPAQVRSERLNNWKNSFNKAKVFVQDKSKTMGIKDSDLTNAIVALDKAYMNLMDIVPKISTMTTGIQLDQMKQALALIFQNINTAISNLSRVKFTLSHKIQAQNVILSMGKILKEIIAASNDTINAQKQSIAPALPPRGTKQEPAPSAPPTRALPATPAPAQPKFIPTDKMVNWFGGEVLNHKSFFHYALMVEPIDLAKLDKIVDSLLRRFKNLHTEELQNYSNQDMIKPISDIFSKQVIQFMKLENQPEKIAALNNAIATIIQKYFPR